jgi:hypothetical protein
VLSFRECSVTGPQGFRELRHTRAPFLHLFVQRGDSAVALLQHTRVVRGSFAILLVAPREISVRRVESRVIDFEVQQLAIAFGERRRQPFRNERCRFAGRRAQYCCVRRRVLQHFDLGARFLQCAPRLGKLVGLAPQ